MAITGKINNALTSLITSRHSLDAEETGRRKLFVIFNFLMITALFIFGTLQLKNGLYSYGIIDYLLILFLITLIFLLRIFKNGKPIYRISTFLLTLILFYWINTGAAGGYSSFWAMVYPLFSFFLLGKREGFIWTVICSIMIISVFINPYSYLTDFSYPAGIISRHLSIYFMVVLFTYNYESIREKYKCAMDVEKAKLFLEKEKLVEAKVEAERANYLLKTEIRLREQAESELREHHDRLEDVVAERTLEIKRNNEILETNEKRYRLMVDNIDDLIWSTDMNLKFLFISPSVSRIYGYTVDEAYRLPLDKWSTPDSYRKMSNIYLNEIEIENMGKQNPDKNIIIQVEQVKKDHTVFTAELKISFIRDESGKAVGIVGITRDISDRIAAEQEREKIKEQLAQSQKMEALGTLVSGLAHDFNNFLSGIIGSFELISHFIKSENLQKRDNIEKFLHLGMESSKRSADLIKQLLILSRRHEIKLSPMDINKSLNHIYDLCSNSFPKSIEISLKTEDNPSVIMGDMVQIEQVLLNLCINASHAMTTMRPDGVKHGGTLSITAEKVDSDSIMNRNFFESAGIQTCWIRIRISDTGVGIDNEIRQRIFEPFFSTKNKIESTGLGLAISYNIITKHAGLVDVYSEPGHGSCFSIYFPVYGENENFCRDENQVNIICGSGTVLVIDDEPVILSIAEGFLAQCGYNVITAGSACEGIEIYRNSCSRISAVLIDLSMPEKSGIEVFKELKEINKNVKAILSSGMLDSESMDNAFKIGIKETVNKPFMTSELSLKMKAVISR